MPETAPVLAPTSELPLSSRSLSVLIVAGETSGDSHGASLITALKELAPGVRILGAGGPRMKAAGQEQLFDLAAHAVIGFLPVLRHYFKFRRFLDLLTSLAQEEQPDAVVLIDYPGFNLRLATKIRKVAPRARVIFYISPQVWAWKPGRVLRMQRDIHLLLTIFPFEVAWFARKAPRFRAEWVGHPLMDRVTHHELKKTEPNTLALLPGSRAGEIRANLAILWNAARLIAMKKKDLRVILLCPNDAMRHLAERIIARQPAANFVFSPITSYAFSHLSRCELALVASGTASLECAVVGIPQVVVYRVNPLTFAIGKRLVSVKFLSIVNVMAGQEVVPELLQNRFTPQAVAQEALALFSNSSRRETMRQGMARVVESLGSPGVNRRVAERVLQEVASPRQAMG